MQIIFKQIYFTHSSAVQLQPLVDLGVIEVTSPSPEFLYITTGCSLVS